MELDKSLKNLLEKTLKNLEKMNEYNNVIIII